MAKWVPSLSKTLKGNFPSLSKKKAEKEISDLQLKMLRIQQGLFHDKGRAIVVFEGFDAAGKGGAIRRLTEKIDPRGVAVTPIGPPSEEEKGKHWMYRFWQKVPSPGTIAIFDRSWYGRVLVEKVDHLIPKEAWKRAYDEINRFEAMLVNDGICLVKLFLAIDRDEQLRRFEERLKDPYKQWKLTEADVHARLLWDEYVKAVDVMFEKTHTKIAPWGVIPANDKDFARKEVLTHVTDALSGFWSWMEDRAEKQAASDLEESLAKLGLKKHVLD